MHWFNPPTLILLIEIIKNDETCQDVAEAVRDLARTIGKKPVIVNKDVLGLLQTASSWLSCGKPCLW